MSSLAIAASMNPYRVERVRSIRYRLDAGSWRTVLERFDALGRRAAVIGPHGSGKTTFLETMCDHLVSGAVDHELAGATLARLFVQRDERGRLRRDWAASALRADASALLIVDGYDLLPPRERFRLRRIAARSAGLIATRHRQGHWPIRLPVLHECRPTAATLRGVLDELEPLGREVVEVEALFADHGGNIRSAIGEMYDRRAGIRCARIRCDSI